MAISALYIESDNMIQVDELTDQSDDSYMNSATVTVTLLDAAGDEVSGETWPLSMPYVSASNGQYKATLSDSLSLVANRRYQAKIVADGGPGKKRTFYVGVNAVRG